MKRIAKVAAVSAAGLGLLIGATPAHAANLGAVAFVGNATLNPGLTYPTGPTTSGGSWTLASTVGVGVSTNNGGAPVVGTATLNVAGTLKAGAVQEVLASNVAPLSYLSSGGYCGLSGGFGGTGAIVLTGIPSGGGTVNVTNVGWVQSLASLIVFQGDTAAGRNYLAGVVTALPTTGSCASGTATGFTVIGGGVSVS